MPYIPKKKEFEKVARLIKGCATPPQVAEKMGVSPATARARLNNPEDLTLGELKRLCQRLHIPLDDLRQAITW